MIDEVLRQIREEGATRVFFNKTDILTDIGDYIPTKEFQTVMFLYSGFIKDFESQHLSLLSSMSNSYIKIERVDSESKWSLRIVIKK